MNKVLIPVGISDFAAIRRNGYYYIDKSGLISELLQAESTAVTLITRPRRFGKTLGMSMLSSFFDIRRDSRSLFQGLEITQNISLCQKWMNQWPTLMVSFKDVDGTTFENAFGLLRFTFSQLCIAHSYLENSEQVSDSLKKIFIRLKEQTATLTDVQSSLLVLTQMLQAHYGKPVILLLDEYDVPIAKASSNGYYTQMLEVMKVILSTSLKDNPALRFAVVTGCLKIAKESIFTGTNNFVSDTISSSRLNEYFGFTQEDVRQLLMDIGRPEKLDLIRRWYDGYHFGTFDVYCPWDVMNYANDLLLNPDAQPVGYWKNTSDNAIIRSFIDYAGTNITPKLETLLQGGVIWQKLEEDLTYDYLHASEDNLWSVLYLTGYLTQVREDNLPGYPSGKLSENPSEDLPDRLYDSNVSPTEAVHAESSRIGLCALQIPNMEIREIYETSIIRWFDDHAKTWNRQPLFDALWGGDCDTATEELNRLLRRTISYHDYREDFYHAFLAGIFTGAGYVVESNREHGEGRSDVAVYDPVNGRAAIIEVKHAQSREALSKACDAALQQIDRNMYFADLEDTYDQILCYGIAFFKKRCLLKKAPC